MEFDSCYWCDGTGWVMVSTETGELIKWEEETCVCTKKSGPTILNLDAMDAAIEALERHKKERDDGNKKRKDDDVKKETRS